MCRWDCVHRLSVRPSKCFDSVYRLMDQRVKEQGQKQVLLHNSCRYASRFPHAEEVFGSAGSWPRAFSFCNHIPRVQFMGSKVVSFSATGCCRYPSVLDKWPSTAVLIPARVVLFIFSWSLRRGSCATVCVPVESIADFQVSQSKNAGPNCDLVEHLVSWTSLEPFQEFCWPFLVFLPTFWANFLSLCLDR